MILVVLIALIAISYYQKGMEKTFWMKKWETADTLFHLKEVNPNLLKVKNLIPTGKVFVPFCGKSLDMDWLAKQGHDVIGAELSPIACKSFFEENNLPYTVKRQGEFDVFEGKNVTIWCGDFFALSRETLGDVASVYDRAALIALPPETRPTYARHVTSLLAARGRTLLVTIEYDQNLVKGPPFSVPESEVRRLFQDAFDIKLHDRHEALDLKEGHSKFKGVVPDITECIFVLDRL